MTSPEISEENIAAMSDAEKSNMIRILLKEIETMKKDREGYLKRSVKAYDEGYSRGELESHECMHLSQAQMDLARELNPELANFLVLSIEHILEVGEVHGTSNEKEWQHILSVLKTFETDKKP